jgi:16S rRNA (guanine966-N2)-methyltransferase
MASPSAKNKAHHGIGQLRIIGGEWRSRRLNFPDGPGLRPTPDRVRETLFNWLAPYVAGARVLDPFAGSGALFLEALSRGASAGLALDSNGMAISSLREHLGTLRCSVGQVQQTDALRYLEAQPATAFDLVFLDPPFNQNLLPTTCALLEERQRNPTLDPRPARQLAPTSGEKGRPGLLRPVATQRADQRLSSQAFKKSSAPRGLVVATYVRE